MTQPMTTRQELHLASRIQPANPNHHLFSNNGSWWCQITVHRGPSSQRLRFSLETRDLNRARELRDQIFANLTTPTSAA